MSTINEDLLDAMDNAITAAEVWLGQKAKRMTLVTKRGSPIHYQFAVGFEITPDDKKLTPKMVTTAIEEAHKVVSEFIASHCRENFVRAVPEINFETDFDTKSVMYRGYMRGSMIGVGADVGPAKISKYESSHAIGFAI
jgi:hypothetical protein